MHMQFGVMKWRIPPDYFNFYFSVKCESKVAKSEDGDDRSKHLNIVFLISLAM